MNEKEKRKLQYKTYSKEDALMIEKMCSSCKFYKDGCAKKRTLRECAVKYLKNRD